MNLFTVNPGRGKPSFTLRGVIVADTEQGSIKFQGLCDGEVIVEGLEYEYVRHILMRAVADSKKETPNGLQ
jgi:hypothetical protein